LDVCLQTFFICIASPVIDCNSQFRCFFNFKSSFFKFFKAKSSTFTDFNVVTKTGTTNGGTKECCWTGCKECCTFCTRETTALFTCWLIEPCPNSTLPVLEKVLAFRSL
jgi:hypothetical protein